MNSLQIRVLAALPAGTEPKGRPILFNDEMVRAIRDGTKTQTRRIVKPQPVKHMNGGASWYGKGIRCSGLEENLLYSLADDSCPLGRIGDRIWVREAFEITPNPSELGLTKDDLPTTWDACMEDAGKVRYRASQYTSITGRWKPSIHMPRWASRITLEITGVRVERLNEISEADAEAEGVAFLRRVPDMDESMTAKELYWILWDSIYGNGSWESNPYVWVIEFKILDDAA